MTARQANHFDLARFVAAVLVMATHAFALTAYGIREEPLVYLSGHRTDLGSVGVAAFFVMSGYLITGSWQRNQRLGYFLRARVFRIVPGLAVALVFCAVVGALLTVTPTLYTHSALSFIGRNLTLYHGQTDLAGVFVNNPYNATVNGSLWTLRYEFTCYLLVAALGMLGQLRGVVVLLIWALACGAWLLAVPQRLGVGLEAVDELLPLMGWFMAGACVYSWQAFPVPRAMWLAIALATALVVWRGWHLLLIAPLLSLTLIRLLMCKGPLTGFGRYGDFSYGLYIYAFPVQQWLVYLMPTQTPWQNFMMALPVTLTLAVLSWYLVERYFLRLKKQNAHVAMARSDTIEPPAR